MAIYATLNNERKLVWELLALTIVNCNHGGVVVELENLYKRVIGLDIHQSQITAYAIILNKSVGSTAAS